MRRCSDKGKVHFFEHAVHKCWQKKLIKKWKCWILKMYSLKTLENGKFFIVQGHAFRFLKVMLLIRYCISLRYIKVYKEIKLSVISVLKLIDRKSNCIIICRCTVGLTWKVTTHNYDLLLVALRNLILCESLCGCSCVCVWCCKYLCMVLTWCLGFRVPPFCTILQRLP